MDATEQKKIRASNIRAVWDALLDPSWTKNDLIDLGKAVYARRSLKDLGDRDPEKFNSLLPHLVKIVEGLENKFIPSVPSKSPEETPPRVLVIPSTPGAPTETPATPSGEKE